MTCGRYLPPCGHRNRALPISILALALALNGQIGSAQTGQDLIKPILQAILEAEDALQKQEPQLAESRYRTALQEGWLLLGALDVAAEDLAAAKHAYETALVSAVESYRAKMSLATLAVKMGNPVEAITPLRLMISMNTMDQQARQLLVQALAANGQMAESIQEMEELKVLFPDDLEIYYQLGTAYLRQQKIDEAQSVLAELAARRPIPPTYVLIGRTYRDFDYYSQAREALNRALEMDPQVRRAHFYLGTLAVFEDEQSGLAKAVDHLQAERDLAPEDPMANLYLGMVLVEARRDEEAVAPLEIARRDPVTERDALDTLGRAYLRLGRAEEAVVILNQALELAELLPDGTAEQLPMDPRLLQISRIHYQLGLAHRRTGDAEAAARHFADAEKYKALQAEDSRERLQTFMQEEPGEQAQKSTSPLELPELEGLSDQERRRLRGELTERLAQVYLNLGVLQVRSQHFARAGDLFAEASSLRPDSLQAQYSLGVARFNSRQFDLATGPLARALELDPTNDELRRMLALAWFNTDHYSEAVALLKDDPQRKFDRSLQYAYGLALVRSGRSVEAQRIFSDLLIKYPDWAELSVFTGQALAQQDDYPGAIESLEKAIQLQPEVAEAHLTLGEIYMRQGELEASEKELRVELEHHPEDLRAQHLLAMVLDLAGKPEEAIQILRNLLEETPYSAKARYLLGKILLSQGNAEQAQIQLESATQLAPEDPEGHYQLGLALQRQGRREEARVAFETYQALKKAAREREPK